MKRTITSMFVALLATVTVQAQQIAVVSGSTTTMYQTLAEAIEGAKSGSTIYLPGGGFQIADKVTITKPLTIIGIGHKANGDNADGNTNISGNITFDEGSSGSSVMGCYISGSVKVGYNYNVDKYVGVNYVNNVVVKYCNINDVSVSNNTCTGTIVNQNFIRNASYVGNSNTSFTNNILRGIVQIVGGTINNNIFIGGVYTSASGYSNGNYAFLQTSGCSIYNNIFIAKAYDAYGNIVNLTSNNMVKTDYGDNCINIEEADWNDVFEKYNNGEITPASSFKFTKDYQQYSNIGIYGGTGFSDSGMAPVPFIEAKDIPDKTDAAGMLKIKVRVKASE